jgi:hypothetical protein
VIRFHIVGPHGLVSVADLDRFEPFKFDIAVEERLLLIAHPQILVGIFTHVAIAFDAR